ncbi:MAG: flagellar motor switch phosphatase FliY [Bacillota bacterium]
MADDVLSQEEIDALLNDDDDNDPDESLTDQEIDAMGEVGNISMGTAATTLYTLLGEKVDITTPKVEVDSLNSVADEFEFPHILIKIAYKAGIEGMNLLVLKEPDVKIITDLMMGGDGKDVSEELTDLHLSAISEAMNQMIGSSSTSLSDMLGEKIDIEPPEAIHDKLGEIDLSDIGLDSSENVVITSFKMTVGDLIDSEIMQIMPIEVAKQLVEKLMTPPEQEESNQEVEQEVEQEDIQKDTQQVEQTQQQTANVSNNQPNTNQKAQQQVRQKQPKSKQNKQQVNAQPLELNNFDDKSDSKYYNNDIDLIKEVPLEISVELGKTVKKISEILEVGEGTVIELDSVVGESLRILANGKQIAKGEVVVVDENYGIRITEIVKAQKIIERI